MYDILIFSCFNGFLKKNIQMPRGETNVKYKFSGIQNVNYIIYILGRHCLKANSENTRLSRSITKKKTIFEKKNTITLKLKYANYKVLFIFLSLCFKYILAFFSRM